MKLINLVFLWVLILFYSCSKPPADTENSTEKNEVREFSLAETGLPLLLPIPTDLDTLAAMWHASTGKAEVDGGEHFNMTLQEMESTISEKKADLELGIFQVEYLEEDSNHIIYQTTLPDGTRHYYHFFAILPVGDRKYVVENNQLMDFSLEDIRKMAQTALHIRPAAE